jgi:hypothetical protein
LGLDIFFWDQNLWSRIKIIFWIKSTTRRSQLFTMSATPVTTNKLGYVTQYRGVVSADIVSSSAEELQAGLKIGRSTTTAMTTTATVTSAAILGGLITGTPGGTATYTLPTGTVFAAAVVAADHKTPVAGDTYTFSITNLSTTDTQVITLAGATGMTFKTANLAIDAYDAAANLNWGTFKIVCTAANTFNVYRVG